MGFLILFLVFFVFVVIGTICCYDELQGVMYLILVIATVIVSVALSTAMLSGDSDTIAKMNAKHVVYTNALENWDEMDYKEKMVLSTYAGDYNDTIELNKRKLNKFMTLGLYSKNVANLPLIEIK